VRLQNFAQCALGLGVGAAADARREVLSQFGRRPGREAPSQPVQIQLSRLAALHIAPLSSAYGR